MSHPGTAASCLGIPTGAQAVAQWRALPRELRDGVRGFAAAHQPYPILEVAAVAVGWARVLQRRRHVRWWVGCTIGALVLDALAVAQARTIGPDNLPQLLALFLILVLVAWSFLTRGRSPWVGRYGGGLLGLIASLNANAVLATRLRQNGAPPRPSQPVTVPARHTVTVAVYPAALAALAAPVAWWFALDSDPLVAVGCGVLALSFVRAALQALGNALRLRGTALVLSEAGVEIPGVGIAAPWSDIAAVVYQTRLNADHTFLMFRLATMEAGRALAARPQLSTGMQARIWGAGGFSLEHLLIRGNPDDAVLAAYGFGGPELLQRALPNLPQVVAPGQPDGVSQEVASLGSDGS